ncbi:MAG: RDD family protein [Dehalococcoidia bacterium]|nr:RDD family protein [Dehalococcoidia bacterium]
MTRLQYAGFAKRFAAALIDVLVVIAIAGILYWFMVFLSIGGGFLFGEGWLPSYIVYAYFTLIGLITLWFYWAAMDSSYRQATVGKIALGIVVCDVEGRRVSFARASMRHLTKTVSLLTLGTGFLMIGFTKRRQALHDIITDCAVIAKK